MQNELDLLVLKKLKLIEKYFLSLIFEKNSENSHFKAKLI